jgi:RNA polymerase sigma-70 factor (ECF subfamily)
MHDAIDHADPRQDGNADGAARRVDLSRAMARLKPRERDLLWLAYAQGSSHREIADVLGLRTSSIKLLLFRARRRLASMMREGSR